MVVLGLYTNDKTDDDLQVFLDAFQIGYTVLVDVAPTYNIYRQTGATSPFPLDYVIDRAGRVAYFSTEYDPEAMTTIIDESLLDLSAVGDLPALGGRLGLEVQPNPFNPRTQIHFRLPRAGRVDLDIHDIRGRIVRRLVAGRPFEQGPGVVIWDGTDDRGRELPSGLYLARIRSQGLSDIQKLTLLR